MKKTLLIAGALLLAATSATSALAQGRPYYGGGYYNARPNPYTQYFRQLRESQRHARLHEELGEAHAEEHYEGLGSRGDHRDLHGALGEAHDAYHYDHPRADYWDGLARMNRPYNGYGQGSYGYGYGQYHYYGNGMSFGFSFGR